MGTVVRLLRRQACGEKNGHDTYKPIEDDPVDMALSHAGCSTHSARSHAAVNAVA